MAKDVPIGGLISTAVPTNPDATQLLFCDGSAVSRTTYADLFAICSTSYGVGDGSTTFNLPDLRGRAVLGEGTGSGLTARSLGDNGGEEDHVILEAELPAHTHAQRVRVLGVGGSSHYSIDGGATVVGGVDTTGSDTGHNTMQPYLALSYFIRFAVLA